MLRSMLMWLSATSSSPRATTSTLSRRSWSSRLRGGPALASGSEGGKTPVISAPHLGCDAADDSSRYAILDLAEQSVEQALQIKQGAL